MEAAQETPADSSTGSAGGRSSAPETPGGAAPSSVAPAGRDISGVGMDRRLPPSRWRRYAPYAGGVLAILVAALLWSMRPAVGSIQSVSGDRLEIATAEQGAFEDFIPARGRVEPARTVYLDAVEGGRVESVHATDGATVQAGDLLVVLSNSQLQLDVISREAEVAQQLNNLQNVELDIESTRIQHARTLVDIDYQITRLNRLVERQRGLVERQVMPQTELEDTMDELAYQQRRKEVEIDSRDTDERLKQTQMEQIRDTTERLQRNLQVARSNLDSLNVTAPIAGVLTALDAEIGQSLQRGERIGQIDSPNEFKLTVALDEFYLPRVATGLRARAEIDGQAYALRVSRIYPQVENGQFTAELLFDGDSPPTLRRGQSLALRLYLGDEEPALTLPAGAFLAQTGGNWAYVVSEDGAVAERRMIRTGRRNAQVVEVLSGLSDGERVVVSSYESFGDVERLELN